MRSAPRVRRAAFTLVEIMVALTLSGVLGGILYALSTEALLSFARNVSINKSYTDARLALDRLGVAVQCAAQSPQLVGVDGKPTTASPAAGLRFYRYAPQASYALPSSGPTLTSQTLSMTAQPSQGAPQVGDVVTIGGIGFQATVASVSAGGSPYSVSFKNADGTRPNDPLSSFCVPANPAAATVSSCRSALLFNRVAFVTVNRQLRYYPAALTSDDANFNNAASYKVVATLPTNPTTLQTTASGLPVNPADENAAQAGLPFRLGGNGTVLVTLCAEAPDYSRRNNFATNAASTGPSVINGGSYNTLGSFGSFTQMQVAYAPRCPSLLR